MKGDSEPMLISNYEFGDNSLLFPDRPTKSHNSDEKRDFRKKHNNEKNSVYIEQRYIESLL